MPRRDYYDDDDDDRPPTRSRRRYEDDDDDDYDPRPRRQSSQSSSAPIVIIAVVIGLVVLLVGGGAAAIFAFRGKPAAQPQPQFAVNNPPPMVNMNQMAPIGPIGPGGPPMPGGPGMPVVAPEMPNIPNGPPIAAPGPAGGTQATISNVRLSGLGTRKSLVFDYSLPGGRPIGPPDIVAVVKEPGQADASVVRLHFVWDQQGTITIDTFGRIGGGFQRGTTVYLGKQALGQRGTPTAISNTLTLQ